MKRLTLKIGDPSCAPPSPASQKQALLIISTFISPGGYFQSLYNRYIAQFLDLPYLDIIY